MTMKKHSMPESDHLQHRPAKRMKRNDEKKSQKSKKAPKPGTPPKKPKPIKPETSRDESLSSTFMLIAGSYEKLLYGIQASISQTNEYTLKPVFIFPAHVSCIKALSASPGGKWLATGSADEIIKVWDLRRRKEVGGLMHHEGSITHLSFPSKSHLISCSEDGTLALFRARDWVVLRRLKGHKGRVNSVAVHPSGKVALSVGKDRTLRMWDLMRGKGCASTKLGVEGELVRWSTDGTTFGVQYGQIIDIYSTDMTKLRTIEHGSRIVDILFCRPSEDSQFLLVGAENKKTSVYTFTDPNSPKLIAHLVGHSNRVKAIQSLKVALPAPSSTKTIIATASSDGKILLYDLNSLNPLEDSESEIPSIQPKAEYDTKGTRLTCLTMTAEATDMGLDREHEKDDGSQDGEGEGLPWASEDEQEVEVEREEEEEE